MKQSGRTPRRRGRRQNDSGSGFGVDRGLGRTPGDSIAVNGVCLTISGLDGGGARFDVRGERLAKTTLKTLKLGSKVNLDRAMSAQGRVGGHIVQGHVDGVGTIAAIKNQGDFAVFRFAASPDLLNLMVLKGSVAVDGVSVYDWQPGQDRFEAALIPTTLNETIWHFSKIGDPVNIETDVQVKIIKRQIEILLPDTGRLTEEKLKQLGF
jgi:riboflavin synthase